jgi:ATP adenylyltransferase
MRHALGRGWFACAAPLCLCHKLWEVTTLKRIWAPWRMKYILSDKGQGCVFCEALKAGDDRARYIVHRGEKAFIILNMFPYTNGHLMIVPYAHVGDLVQLDRETMGDMMLLTQKALQALRDAMGPHGFNVGLNLGEAAGAGIRDHVHIHIVPRWHNDTNFMPALADVRVIPESLPDTYAKLLAALHK